MRGFNEQMVLKLVREQGPVSRAELARRSHLSRSTISSVVASLLAENYVYEIGIGDSQGGRRPIMLDFNERASIAVGIDIAASGVTMLLTDLRARVLQRSSERFDLIEGPDACLPRIVTLFHAAVRSAGVEAASIGGIGVGVPSPISDSTRRRIVPLAMPGWRDVPLRELLERTFERPILLDNDANLGALAEQAWGAACGLTNVAYIYFGSTGIGGGLILDGKLYHGQLGSAGEIGHITIDEDGPICRCGANGCLEALIGVPALLARAAESGLMLTSVAELIVVAQAGNLIAQNVLAMAGAHLGVAIASLLNLLNPGGVVLGGELATAGDLLLDPLRATLVRRGLAAASQHVVLRPGTLGSDVIALGAAALAINNVLSHPLSSNTPRPTQGTTVGRIPNVLSAS